MAETTPAKALIGARTAIGGGALVAPRLSGRLFGFDVEASGELPYLSRLFAVRDLALGAGLLASHGEARRTWLRIGVACDVSDALAGVVAGARGELGPLTTVLVTAAAVTAAGLGIAALGATPPASDAEPAAVA
jgi:hypothetical protein